MDTACGHRVRGISDKGPAEPERCMSVFLPMHLVLPILKIRAGYTDIGGGYERSRNAELIARDRH